MRVGGPGVYQAVDQLPGGIADFFQIAAQDQCGNHHTAHYCTDTGKNDPGDNRPFHDSANKICQRRAVDEWVINTGRDVIRHPYAPNCKPDLIDAQNASAGASKGAVRLNVSTRR